MGLQGLAEGWSAEGKSARFAIEPIPIILGNDGGSGYGQTDWEDDGDSSL